MWPTYVADLENEEMRQVKSKSGQPLVIITNGMWPTNVADLKKVDFFLFSSNIV